MHKPLLAIVAIFALFASGCGTTTVDGEHVGYVTAVEKSGLIWKTSKVYLKSKLESSQEDVYCVENDDVYNELIKSSEQEQRVKLKYHSEFITAPWRCDSEAGIVDAVEVLTTE